MDNYSDTSLEEREIFESNVSVLDFGATFSLSQKSVKPEQKLEISLSKDHIKTEPNLIVTNCGDYQQTTSFSPSTGNVETDSDLTVTLESSTTMQNDSPSCDSVFGVVKDGIGSNQPESERITDLKMSQTGYDVIIQEDCSDAADFSQTSAQNGVDSKTNQNADSMDASNPISSSREIREPPQIQTVDSDSTDIVTNGSQMEAEPTPAPVNGNEPPRTPSGEAPQDLMPQFLIQKTPPQCATMAKHSLSQSPVTFLQDVMPNGHSTRTGGAQDTLDSTLNPKVNSVPQAPALRTDAKLLEDVDTSTKNDVSPPQEQVTYIPSVPPHLRPVPAGPRLWGFQTSRQHGSPSEMPQCPRDKYPQRQPQYATNAMRDRDRDEIPRVQAQNMQLRKELDMERERNEKIMNVVRADNQKDIDAVLGPILAAQVHEKIALAKEKTLVSQQKIDLERRNKLIEQTEAFLAAGQRELYYQADAQDTSTLTHKEHEYAQKQGATNATATMRLRELDLQLGYNELNIQRADLESRQQVYKLLVQRKIEVELRAVLEREFEARTRQISKDAYNRGFKEGREEAQKENVEDANEAAFAEGYATARRQQNALVALKNGSLPYDSPDLDFLTNPDHPDNLFNMGMQVGRRETVVKKVRKTTPARPTIFEQINGASTKVNGQHILANHQSRPVKPIPNLMDDGPTPTNGTFISVHNQHALPNRKTTSVNIIPNLLDDDVALIDGAANHINNPLSQANGSSQRIKERHVEVYTDGKASRVNMDAVPTHGNTSLSDDNRAYTDGSAAPAEGENVPANGTASNGNTRMADGQPTSENIPGSSSENAESSHRMRSMPLTTHHRADEVVAATANDFLSGKEMECLH